MWLNVAEVLLLALVSYSYCITSSLGPGVPARRRLRAPPRWRPSRAPEATICFVTVGPRTSSQISAPRKFTTGRFLAVFGLPGPSTGALHAQREVALRAERWDRHLRVGVDRCGMGSRAPVVLVFRRTPSSSSSTCSASSSSSFSWSSWLVIVHVVVVVVDSVEIMRDQRRLASSSWLVIVHVVVVCIEIMRHQRRLASQEAIMGHIGTHVGIPALLRCRHRLRRRASLM